MKREDLFGALHDQYNTFPSSIQDPEAFHHDVFEISHEAASTDDFHRRMHARKSQRLAELNDLLSSAAVEIIANPNLIGTSQWQYALQLFRTKSLDSLVRYFASYLPDDHPWHRSDHSSSITDSDVSDSVASSLESSFFADKPVLTHEPEPLSVDVDADAAAPPHHHQQQSLPLSPRSMTMCSDSSSTADMVAHTAYVLHNLTPARTMSFSGSESEHFGLKESCPALHDDDASQPSEAQTPVSSVADLSEMHHHDDFVVVSDVEAEMIVHGHHDECPADKTPAGGPVDSETPTPRREAAASAGFFEPSLSSPSLSSLRRHSRSPEQTRRSASHAAAARAPSSRSRRRDAYSPPSRTRRRSPAESVGRIRKQLPDPAPSSRPRGRRRVGC